MSLFELEQMAATAKYEELDKNGAVSDPAERKIKELQGELGYTYDEATEFLRLISTKNKSPTTAQQELISPAQARIIYGLKLDDIICTPQNVQIARKPFNSPTKILRQRRKRRCSILQDRRSSKDRS
jgi:hypothetical protein